ncbi:MAG: NADH:ubiquinone oxidoreductase subunit NDUFA12 [Parvularculaceae bacterium]
MLNKFFTWWNGATFGALLTIKSRGRLVGEDSEGNRYFEERKGASLAGQKRRWVIYKGVAEASRVPPDWHGWLHHTFDEPPTTAPLKRQKFEKDHLPNMTGTPLAQFPPGSLVRGGVRPHATGDYEAWTPGE